MLAKEQSSLTSLRDFYFFLCTRRLNVDTPKKEHTVVSNQIKIKKTTILGSFLRSHAGCITHYGWQIPMASPVMKMMSEYYSWCVSFWLRNRCFERSPLLLKCPTSFYPAPLWYLSFSAVSISQKYIIWRKYLPLLGRIFSYYSIIKGTYLEIVKRNPIVRNPYMVLIIDERGLKNMNMDETNIVRRKGVKDANDFCDRVNFSICIGFKVWYVLMPAVLLSSTSYADYDVLLNPENVQALGRIAHGWLDQVNQMIRDAFMSTGQGISISIMDGVGAEQPVIHSAEHTLRVPSTFDPLLINEAENHQRVLKRLVFSCLAACVLTTTTYAGLMCSIPLDMLV